MSLIVFLFGLVVGILLDRYFNPHTPPVSQSQNIPIGIGKAQIIYKDAQGDPTKRTITIIAIYSRDDDYKIYAYCHLRNDYRTFLSTRIQELMDLKSGKVTDEPVKQLDKYITNLFSNAA